MPEGKKDCTCDKTKGEWTGCTDIASGDKECPTDMPEGKKDCTCDKTTGEWEDCQDNGDKPCTEEIDTEDGKVTAYCISSFDDLKKMRDAINEGKTWPDDKNTDNAYILTNDITIESDTNNPWIPIGKLNMRVYYEQITEESSEPFKGKFFGNNKTISGEIVCSNDYNYCGLFGYTQDAILKDVNLSLKKLSLLNQGHSIIGAIASVIRSTTISSCNVMFDSSTDYKYELSLANLVGTFGTLVGLIESGTKDSMIAECNYTMNDKKIILMKYSAVGGLLGKIKGNTTIKDCSFKGNMDFRQPCTSGGSFGGIVGSIDVNESGHISISNVFVQSSGLNLSNAGNNNGNAKIGGIVGYINRGSATLTNIGVTDIVISVHSDSTHSIDAGGIIGSTKTATTSISNAFHWGDIINDNEQGEDQTVKIGTFIGVREGSASCKINNAYTLMTDETYVYEGKDKCGIENVYHRTNNCSTATVADNFTFNDEGKALICADNTPLIQILGSEWTEVDCSTGEKWHLPVPKTLASVLNPSTFSCVECRKDSDCSTPGYICSDNKCGCNSGNYMCGSDDSTVPPSSTVQKCTDNSTWDSKGVEGNSLVLTYKEDDNGNIVITKGCDNCSNSSHNDFPKITIHSDEVGDRFDSFLKTKSTQFDSGHFELNGNTFSCAHVKAIYDLNNPQNQVQDFSIFFSDNNILTVSGLYQTCTEACVTK